MLVEWRVVMDRGISGSGLPSAAERLAGLNLRGLESDFYEAAGKGRLVFSRCRDCGRAMFPLRNICLNCGSTAVDLVDSLGRGVVQSISTVSRSPHPAFRSTGPYQVAIVKVDEGFNILSNIDGECTIDQIVEVAFTTDDEGRGVPYFRSSA